MSLPTCEVVCVVRDQSGNPEVGAIVEATLSDFDVSLGYVVPERVHAETGVDGICKLNLWPNELGSTGSFYNVRIRTKSGRSERLRVTVPNQVQALLQDIAELPAYSGKPDSYLATEQAVYAASQALSHSLTAQNAASSSSSSVAQAAASESAANVSAVAAAASQVAAAASESAAATSASQASASASAAGASQSASASSASAAAGSELAAASSATAAAASATAAQGSQTAAATSASSAAASATNAAASATNAAASATNAAASASAASTSQTAAAASATTATAKATEAQGHANDAATSASQASASAATAASAAASVNPDALVPRAGGVTMTGPLSVPAGASGTQVPQAQEVGGLANTQLGLAGQVGFFARNTAPTGWLKANGATISRTTYAALFAAIGTQFGAGDGSTTFTLPDMRGEFPRGWDDGRGIDTGRAFGSAQLDAFQGHKHYQALGGTLSTAANSAGTYVVGNQNVSETYDTRTDPAYGAVRAASETRPRNIALLACIKF